MPKKKFSEDDPLIEEAGLGHNSFSKEELENVCEAVEAANEEIATIRDHIKAVMEVADQKGLDKRAIREALKARALDPGVLAAREEFRDLYFGALGLK